MKKMAVVIAVFIAVAMISGTAFTWGGGCGSDKEGKCSKTGPWKKEMKKELGITPEQDKLLEAQRTKHFEDVKATRETLKAKKDELRKAIARPGVTRQQVQPIVDQIKTLEGQMAEKMVDGIFAMKAILTPEQFSKMEALKEKCMKECKEKYKDRLKGEGHCDEEKGR